MASIKRPLSRENTSPSQKMMSFFCRDIIQYEISPLSLPASGFSKFIGKDLFGFMERAVSMRQIETVSKQIMSKHVLMLFDSCFSGAIFQMVRAKPSPYIQEKSYPVRQFITAGTENEQVPDKSVFKLDKKTAPKSSLNVNTNPNDAKVRILNIGQKFYQGIELKSGCYHVEVSADEYETKKLWVTLGSGEDKSIDVRLKKRAVAASSSYSSYSSAREIKRDGRFVAYANGTVKDTKTGLMWASKDNGEGIKWEDAKRYCENYRGGVYTDWRMPTLDELKGLYDKSESYQPTQTTYNVYLTKLIELSSCCPWTSETRGSGAAFFNFYDGSSGSRSLSPTTSAGFCRCVVANDHLVICA